MPEAVIVSTARSPIGRANKGSLVDLRPDDLAATIVQAALAKVPQLDPTTVEDLMIGCAQPAGEQGYNLGRVVAILAGMDDVPGHHREPLLLVVAADDPHGRPRDQVRRGRRVHRGRRRVREPLRQGPLRRQPRHHQRPLRRGAGAHQGPPGSRSTGMDSRGGDARHLHRDGPDRGERRAGRGRDAARRWTSSRRARSNAPSSRSTTASSSARSSRSRCPTARSSPRTTDRATAPPPRSSRS